MLIETATVSIAILNNNLIVYNRTRLIGIESDMLLFDFLPELYSQ